jgi:hypothetical protein
MNCASTYNNNSMRSHKMGIAERIGMYEKIEDIRNRPLITYITSSRPNAAGKMATDAIPELIDQFVCLPAGCAAVDLLVVSYGGDPTVAWRIMTLLRERVDTVGVLVPQSAFSAATLLALGADEIVMHPYGNLGPVDPQIEVHRQKPGSPEREIFQFGSEDLAGYLNFVRESVGLTDQANLKSAFEMFCNEVGSVPIGVATRSSRLSLSMGEKLLRMHMQDDAEGQKAKTIAQTLNSKFFHHGYSIGRKEAKEIGLKAIDATPELEQLMWDVWRNIEDELKCREPFHPITELINSGRCAGLFSDTPMVNIPANLPPAVLQQVVQNVLQQINVASIPVVDYDHIAAVIESRRKASSFRIGGKIFAQRNFESKLIVNPIKTFAQWEPTEMPGEGGPS